MEVMATRADMEKSQEEEMRTPKQMGGVTYILQLHMLTNGIHVTVIIF